MAAATSAQRTANTSNSANGSAAGAGSVSRLVIIRGNQGPRANPMATRNLSTTDAERIVMQSIAMSIQRQHQQRLQQLQRRRVLLRVIWAIFLFAVGVSITMGLIFGLAKGHSSDDDENPFPTYKTNRPWITQRPQNPATGATFYANFLYKVAWDASMGSTSSSTFKTYASRLENAISEIYKHTSLSHISISNVSVTQLGQYSNGTIQVVCRLTATRPSYYSYLSSPSTSDMDDWFASGYDRLTNSISVLQSVKEQASAVIPFTFLVSTSAVHLVTPPSADVPCGDVRVLPDVRIVGGSETARGSFPWMVMLIKTDGSTKDRFFCGGSILDKWHILTAGHCLKDEPKSSYTGLVNTRTNSLKVIAGKYESNTSTTYPYEQRIPVKVGFTHPDFSMSPKLVNDIAVIRLSRPLEFNSRVTPICLPESSDPLPPVCVAAGWGRIGSMNNNLPRKLRAVSMRAYNSSECRRTFRSTFSFNRHSISYYLPDNSIICAANNTFGGQDTCQGDSGGPLFCPQAGPGGEWRYSQFGVVSWGDGCGSPGEPGFYTSLPFFQFWIHAKALPALDGNSGSTGTSNQCRSFSPLTDYRLYSCRTTLRRLSTDAQCSGIKSAVNCVVNALSRYSCSEQEVGTTILNSSQIGLTSSQRQKCSEVLFGSGYSVSGNGTCNNHTAVSSALSSCTMPSRCVSLLEVTACVHSFLDPRWQQCSQQSLQDYLQTNFNHSLMICKEHAVRTLADGRQFMFEGGAWYALCGDHWGQNEVKVACTNRGFNAGVPSFIHKTEEDVYVSDLSPSTDVHHSVRASGWLKVTCSGNEKSLGDCALERQPSCPSSYLAASVCYNKAYHFSLSAARSLRGADYGYVALNRDAGQGTVCVPELSDTAAHLLCREAGYVGGMVYPKPISPPSDTAVWETEMNCGAGAVDVNSCTHGKWTLMRGGSGSCALAKVSCFTTEARLHNGFLNATGLVQMYQPAPNGHDVALKTVCRQGFTDVAAGILCRQLGFSGGGSSLSFNAFYKPNTHYVSVQCRGTERRLEDCILRNASLRYCTEPASVQCSSAPSTPGAQDLSVRLSGPRGQVQVSMGGQWGTVCADHWTDNEAAAICRQLGHLHGYRRFPEVVANPRRSLPHVLHSVRCGANANSLHQCSYSGVSSDACQHSPSAAVLCSDQSMPVYSLADQTSGFQDESQVVHVDYKGTAALLRSAESERTASAVCQALGFVAGRTGSGNGWFSSQGTFWWLDSQSNCTDRPDLQQCLQDHLERITCSGQLVQDSRCQQPVVTVYCYKSAARVNVDANITTGIVELYRNGQWWKVCHDDITQPAADVICQDIMDSTSASAVILNQDVYWPGRNSPAKASVYCNARDTGMTSSECIVLNENSKCASFNIAPAAVVCYDGRRPSGSITRVKLEGGRVWVKRYGVWGTICLDKWRQSDAEKVCSLLGYSYGDYTSNIPAHDPTTPLWAWSMTCPSWAYSFSSCQASFTNSEPGNCNFFADAMAQCLRF